MSDATTAGQASTIKIALAADSAIYAPLYLAIDRLKNHLLWHQLFDWDYVRSSDGLIAGLGDREAYKCLRDMQDEPARANIAVCDPMVVAEQAVSLRTAAARTDTTGVVVGFLIRRPMVWALCPDGKHRRGKPDENVESLPHRTLYRQGVTIDSMALYENCTASMLAEFMRTGSRPFWNIRSTETIAPGREWSFIPKQCPSWVSAFHPGLVSPAPAAQLCLTCDPLIAYSLDEDRSSARPNSAPTTVFSWPKFSQVPDFPFTAVVARRDWLATPFGMLATRILLFELHKTIDNLLFPRNHAFEHEAEACARAFLSARRGSNGSTGRFTALGSERSSDKQIHAEFVAILRHMCTCVSDMGHKVPVYASCLWPDWSQSWIRSGWDFSARTLWCLATDPEDKTGERLFKACTTNQIAPRGVWKGMLGMFWWVRSHALSLNAVLFSLLATIVTTFAMSSIDNQVRTKFASWISNGYLMDDLVSALRSIWFPSDMFSFVVILIIWCVVCGMGSILVGWKRLSFPRLNGQHREGAQTVKLKILGTLSFLLIPVWQVCRIVATVCSPVTRRLATRK